jgi:arsenite methyltransferase
MAELTTPDGITGAAPCCAPEHEASCCAPSEKATCCDPSHGDNCSCAAGNATETPGSDIREQVRRRYAEAALSVTTSDPGSGCCAPSEAFDGGSDVFGAALYALGDQDNVVDSAALASLGCGNPIAIAELHEGETVLDLGSGGGLDVLLSAKRVGPTGRAYGLDMTDEMLTLARENQDKSGVDNVQWLRGHIEQIPLPADTIDVVISNCVINLSGDKARVLAEAARVLRPGGRFAVSDVIADENMDDATRADMQAYTGCIAGALTEAEFREQLAAAGFSDIEIQPTHRVHASASAAIVRAKKPTSQDQHASTRPVR